MKVKEIFGQASPESIQSEITKLSNYDKDLTIEKILKDLNKLLPNIEEKTEKERAELLNKLLFKCFKINFGENHIVWLKIDDVDLYYKYAQWNAKIIGKKISFYNGEIEAKDLVVDEEKGGGDEWGQYSYNEGIEEIKVEQFNEMYGNVVNLINNFINS